MSGLQSAIYRPDPTAGAEAIYSFVLWFPGQVLTDCRLRFATSMQGLRVLHNAIALVEIIPTVFLPRLADAWLMSYTAFLPPDLNIDITPSNQPPIHYSS